MTPADAARILGVAAVYDRRTVGELDAKAWADALNDLDPRECAEAVRRHYRDSTAWLMPARVRELTTVLRRERAQAARSQQVLAELEAAKDAAASDPRAVHDAREECRAAFAEAITTKRVGELQPIAQTAGTPPEVAS